MSTKKAQRAAHEAWAKRLVEGGGKRIAITFSAEGLAALDKLTEGDNRKRSEALMRLLVEAANPPMVPIQVLDVDAEHRLPGPVKPSGRKLMASKLDTSSVPVHPGLRGNK